MEVALVTFVGAGLTSLSAGFGIAVPEGAIANGYELVRYLSKEDDNRTKAMVMQTVGEIWQDWRKSGLPADIASQHVSALPLLMDRHRYTGELLIGAIGAASASAKQGGQGNAIHGRRLAAQILSTARDAGSIAEFGMSEPIAFFFLDRLYTRLLVERAYVDSLLPLLDVYFYKGLWRSLAGEERRQGPATEVEAVVERFATPLALQPEAPAHCQSEETGQAWAAAALQPQTRFAIINDAGTATDEFADEPPSSGRELPASAGADFQVLARQVAGIANGTPAGQRLREAAVVALEAGDAQFADRRLAEAEDAELQAAQTDIVNVRQFLKCATETRAARGSIEELRGNWRRAARHYAAAVRCLPTSDSKGRGEMLSRQALALMKQGECHHDTQAMGEAATAFAEAGTLQIASCVPEDWAAGQLMLAGLLVVLGEREGRIERYEAAARHARAAGDVWSQSRNMVDWARAHLMFADALRLRGESVRSTIDLEEAQFAYRAALGVFARDRSPEDWVMASANLGQVMVRLGELGAGTDSFQHGLQHIDAGLALGGRLGMTLDLAKLQTARGNALLGLFAANDTDRLAAEAIEAFSLALGACDQEKYPHKAVSMRHRLGMAMWAFGAHTRAVDILSEAYQELAGVRVDAEHLGDTARVSELQEDLAVLSEDIARISADLNTQERKIA